MRPPPDQLVLLVQNEAGYRNLMKLTSDAFLGTEPGLIPQVSLSNLAAHAEGLLALTGGWRAK
jgi:DNA polymerase-3 subunit alpha